MTTHTESGILRNTIAGNVSVAMARAGVSRAALAKTLEVDPAWVTRRTKGQVPLNMDEVERIADAIGADARTLLEVP